MKAYTYYLYHKPTGLKYYGVRFKKGCKTSDLWTTYFTSCKNVHKLIAEHGENSFEYEIRKTFKTIEQARDWEHKVLRRLNVLKRTDWINKSHGKANLNNKTYGMLGKHHTEESKMKSRLSQLGPKNHMYGKAHRQEAKRKIAAASTGRTWTDKMRKNFTEKTKGHPCYLTNHTTESINKIKEARKKQVFDETSKQKMSEAAKGRKWFKCPTTGKRIFYRE